METLPQPTEVSKVPAKIAAGDQSLELQMTLVIVSDTKEGITH